MKTEMLLLGKRLNEEGTEQIGVDRASMFPDLDGIALHVDWLRTDEY